MSVYGTWFHCLRCQVGRIEGETSWRQARSASSPPPYGKKPGSSRVMRRIIVVGCQGSGKTSLALRLGRTLSLPVVHLDVLYWRPGWKESDEASFRLRVTDVIASEGWVVDGSFPEHGESCAPCRSGGR